jgi:hypothetical protein
LVFVLEHGLAFWWKVGAGEKSPLDILFIVKDAVLKYLEDLGNC